MPEAGGGHPTTWHPMPHWTDLSSWSKLRALAPWLNMLKVFHITDEETGAENVTSWLSTWLTCMKPWIQIPALLHKPGMVADSCKSSSSRS